MMKNLISFVIGLAAGIFGGMIGLGGGVIMIPLMTGLIKIDQCRAHGTSLAVLIFTGVSGAFTYGIHGQVDWTAALALAAGAVLTAPVGAHLADRLPGWKLKRTFGVFLIVCSLLLLFKPLLAQMPGKLPHVQFLIAMGLTGIATGFLSGIMGVGGGMIMVPVMILLAGFTQHTAQGTALLVMIPTGAVGAFTHWRLGNVDHGLLFGMIPGILLGTFIGGNVAQVIPDAPLRWLFVFTAVYMGWRYLRTIDPAVC